VKGLRGKAAVAALLAAAACAHGPVRNPEPARAPPRAAASEREVAREPDRDAGGAADPERGAEVGLASYYSRRHHGRRTASGARFDMHAFTCAHRSAPFGTRLRVTALESGRSVVVTVTDRGPFSRGRVVDVSLAAARKLGMVQRGVVRVRVERDDAG
jgi:rare lipoprotein A